MTTVAKFATVQKVSDRYVTLFKSVDLTMYPCPSRSGQDWLRMELRDNYPPPCMEYSEQILD